jgi:hypothetical protein
MSKSNSISKDFPLYHSDIIPIFNSQEINNKGKKILFSNIYTNEHPDFLKLDCMKEKGYRNPYLEEVIKVDRSEELKKLEKNKPRLELINYLKSNRKYSQDPSKLKYIQSEFDIEMYNKRTRIKENDKNNNKKKYLITNQNDANYNNLLTNLNFFAPKVHYQNLQYRKKDLGLEERKGKWIISKENFAKLEKIRSDLEPQKSAYLSNCNDYKIYEADKRDKNRELTFKRNDFIKVDIITGNRKNIKLPEERNDKWGKFYENFFLMMNKSYGFRKKGGLFTEFSNKNIGSINVNKNDIRERLKKEKEKRCITFDKSYKNNK